MVSNKPENMEKTLTPGRVMFLDGQGELPMIGISTIWSSAEIYLQGAHITNFRKHGEPPLTFMSQCSRFTEGQPIRGGIPVIFPWFGMREGMGSHGFAADYVITVSESLLLQLIVSNQSVDEPLIFENCFHTYFEVGDITAISIHGLQGVSYLDKVANFAQRTEPNDAIRIASEVDRTYLDTAGAVEIHDPRLGRKIRIEKQGSNSTVVWNPWIAKSQQMPDFGNDEYQRMVCVESGNVSSNVITLPPGRTSTLTTRLSCLPLS